MFVVPRMIHVLRQLAFDVDPRALVGVFTGALRDPSEGHYPMPFGVLDDLAGLVVGSLRAGDQADVGRGATVRQVLHLWSLLSISTRMTLLTQRLMTGPLPRHP